MSETVVVPSASCLKMSSGSGVENENESADQSISEQEAFLGGLLL